MRSISGLVVSMLLLGGSVRAAPVIPPNYVVLALRYEGCQEKPIWPVVIGDSAESAAWYEATYINSRPRDYYTLVYRHASGPDVAHRLVSEVPHLSLDDFAGAKPGKELEIAVVEHGQRRYVFTRSDVTDALLKRFILDSDNDAELRALVHNFESEVDRYARLMKCDMAIRPRALGPP
jgi:hypothetical protein